MLDSTSRSDVQLTRYSGMRTSVPGGYGDLQDRIVPAGIPPVCDAAWSVDCLPSPMYRRHNSAYFKAVIADSLASGPFEDFLVKKDCVKARLLLNFWRDAQVHSLADLANICCIFSSV